MRGVDPRPGLAQALAVLGLGCELRHGGGGRLRGVGMVDSTRSVYSSWTGIRRKVAAHLVGAPPAGDKPGSLGVASTGG